MDDGASIRSSIRKAFAAACARDKKREYTVPAEKTALMVIDVQKRYSDPRNMSLRGNEDTDRIAKRIARLAPAFRKTGVSVYAVFFAPNAQRKPRGDFAFHEFTLAPGDKLVSKNSNSAFTNRLLYSRLKKDGKKSLLVCGFNLVACVHDTVIDALNKKLKVCVLKDLVGTDNHNAKHKPARHVTNMKAQGATMMSSHAVLLNLKNKPR